MSKQTYQKWWIFFHLVIKKFFIKSTNGHRSCLVESTVDLGHTQTWAVVWAAWHWGSHIEFQSPSGILGVHLLTLNWSQYKGHRKSLVQLLTHNRPSAIVVQSLSHVQLFVTPWTILCSRGFPGKNTGVGCHSLFWGIFPNQGLNPGLLHWRQILYYLRHQEPACQRMRHNRLEFNPWVGKIPWRRAWQPNPVFFPGKSNGQKSLMGYNP